jgi:hypothetical protein
LPSLTRQQIEVNSVVRGHRLRHVHEDQSWFDPLRDPDNPLRIAWHLLFRAGQPRDPAPEAGERVRVCSTEGHVQYEALHESGVAWARAS